MPSDDDAESDARGEASGGGWLLCGDAPFVVWDLADVSEGARSMGLEETSGDLVGLGLRLRFDCGFGVGLEFGLVGLGLRLVFLGEGMGDWVFGAGERGILTLSGEPGVANENEFFFCTTFAPPPPLFTSATDANELVDSFLLNTDTLLPVVAVVGAVVVADMDEDETIPDFFTTPSSLSFRASLLTFAQREGTLPDRIIVLVGDFVGDRCAAGAALEMESGDGDGIEVEEEKVGRSWGGSRTEIRRLTGSRCVSTCRSSLSSSTSVFSWISLSALVSMMISGARAGGAGGADTTGDAGATDDNARERECVVRRGVAVGVSPLSPSSSE